ncbi:hypothetical protein [Nocardiopsis sp. L17-MgMaSL7]|uniref:hypothetical protein n=1 Tax=Nocardiopsis sp. L17-MgMaSL7 TaxID=1938893 RepID=UPI000D715A44|nr:hypothetical protein [Nocardiopsis sp. L17-MgMaSL7]PWV52309.1 hypothetical protein BDW27_106228 [Nocardiopsis sp. L17-MgMaSL7]
MLDTYTGDLLAAVGDALLPPARLTPQELAEWHAHTLRNRLPLIHEALRMAQEEDDAELATQMIDQAITDHPNLPAAPRAERRVPREGSSGGELPVPEHVLCDLLYRHWAMTIEGKPPHEKYVARRPLGWSGEGDPFERITAPTRTELLRLLAHRHLGVGKPDPGPSTT